MKYSLIVAALIGATSAIKLEHHHRHHHGHRRQPNIGVRFIQSNEQDIPGGAANNDVVADAAPEVNQEEDPTPPAVKAKAEDKAVLAAKKTPTDKQKAEAITEEIKAEEKKKAPPVEAPDTVEEYKELKKEVEEKSAKLKEAEPELDEDEQAAKEQKNVQDLVDNAELNKKLNKKAEIESEIGTLNKEAEAEKEALKDPDNVQSANDLAETKAMNLKNDEKKAELEAEVADIQSGLGKDIAKKEVREAEEKASIDKQAALSGEVAAKAKKLKAFEDAKLAADQAITKQFEADVDTTPHPMPGSNKLKIAEAKVKKMIEEDEAVEAAKEQAKKDALTENPNPVVVANEKKQDEYDEEARLARIAAAAASPLKVVLPQRTDEQRKVHMVTAPLRGEAWVSNMPDYILDNPNFKKMKN